MDDFDIEVQIDEDGARDEFNEMYEWLFNEMESYDERHNGGESNV